MRQPNQEESMKVKNILFVMTFLMVIVIAAPAEGRAEDMTGTWQGKMHIPNFGPYEMTMKLEKMESGYKGIVNDEIGYIEKDTKVQELEVVGHELVCWFEMADGAVCDLRLTEEDGIMTGEAERQGGVVSCVFVREKKK
jgi:hypothetical protein